MKALLDVPGIGAALATTLTRHGIDSIGALARSDARALSAIRGIGARRAPALIAAAHEMTASPPASSAVSPPAPKPARTTSSLRLVVSNAQEDVAPETAPDKPAKSAKAAPKKAVKSKDPGKKAKKKTSPPPAKTAHEPDRAKKTGQDGADMAKPALDERPKKKQKSKDGSKDKPKGKSKGKTKDKAKTKDTDKTKPGKTKPGKGKPTTGKTSAGKTSAEKKSKKKKK